MKTFIIIYEAINPEYSSDIPETYIISLRAESEYVIYDAFNAVEDEINSKQDEDEEYEIPTSYNILGKEVPRPLEVYEVRVIDKSHWDKLVEEGMFIND